MVKAVYLGVGHSKIKVSGPPGWGLDVGLTTLLYKKHIVTNPHTKNSRMVFGKRLRRGKGKSLELATWNVRGLAQAGASRNLEQVLQKYNVDIVALQEIKWRKIEIMDLATYMIINSGHQANILGTGFMIKKSLKYLLLEYKVPNERICIIRLKGKFFNISIISVHAPTEDSDEEEKDIFYENLSSAYDELPRHDVKVIMGDLNAKIGKEQAFRSTIGAHSKHDITNDNGLRIIDFAMEKGMIVSSTQFPHKEIHKETWISPDGRSRNQIDHVLIDARHASDISNVRSYRGADVDSDHFLIKATYLQKLAKRARGQGQKTVRYNSELLKLPEYEERFKERVHQCLHEESSEMRGNIDDEWDSIKMCIKNTANELLGVRRTGRRSDWFDEECERALKDRNEARMKVLKKNTRQAREEYKAKRKVARGICRRKKRALEKEKLDDLQIQYDCKQTRKFYRGVRDFKDGFQPRTNCCKDKEGKLVGETEKIVETWKEYFECLLNSGENAEGQVMESTGLREEDGDEVEPPDMEEFLQVIKSLKNNKSPGCDSIDAEMLKYGGEDLQKQIYNLVLDVWLKEKMPKEWTLAIVCPIYKKGDRLKCDNYRGISLLGTVYKIFAILLNQKLQHWSENSLGEYQCGFRQNRSTIDHIFSLRQMLEKTYEFDIELHHLFIDFRQAYDSIKREELLKAMLTLGVPRKLVRLTELTLAGSSCRVKVQGLLSDAFAVKDGLRQGDPLSPTLFNIALEVAIRAIRTNPNGTIYNRMSQHLAYADDVVLSARSMSALAGVYEEFEAAARKMGLHINDEKTFYLKTSRRSGRVESSVSFGSHVFKSASQFKYLGALVTEKNEITEEIKARVAAGNRCFFALQKPLKFRSLTSRAKVLIYKTIIRPVVTYGCEGWVLTKATEKMLNIWERKVLRRIFGPVCESGHWRIRKNEELRQMFGEPDLVTFVRKNQLRWLGHVERMPQNRIPKKLLEGKPGGSRNRGRPRLRWLDGVEEVLRGMGVRRWRRYAQDRAEWQKIVEEAQVLVGP